MAIAKRWTIPFSSRSGKVCRVDIYEDGWTGSVQTLTGGEKTFYFEEDDSDNLLNVIRPKTGYINVVETYDGELDGLEPATNTAHYVEVFYGAGPGSEKCFCGFMQAISFENEWKSSPREMQFPVVSTLGILSSIKLNRVHPPRWIGLNEVMNDMLTMLNTMTNGSIKRIYFPQTMLTMTDKLNSLVISPYSDDYQYGWATLDYLYSPITYYDFIEALCNYYHVIVHETPTAYVFAGFSLATTYYYCDYQNLEAFNFSTTPYSGDEQDDLDDFFSLIFRNGRMSRIMPADEIITEIEGEYIDSASLDFSRQIYVRETIYSNTYVAWLASDSNELSGQYLSNNGIIINSTDGSLSPNIAAPCSIGGISEQQKAIIINNRYDGSFENMYVTDDFFCFTIENPLTVNSGNIAKLTIDYEWGSRIFNIGKDTSISHFYLGVKIMVGDKYYSGQGVWQTGTPQTAGQFTFTPDYELTVSNIPQNQPIMIYISTTTGTGAPTNQVPIVQINNITLKEQPGTFEDLKIPRPTQKKEEIAAGTGDGKYSVSLMFNNYVHNSNQVGTTTQPINIPLYNYLKTAQDRLQVNVKWKKSFSWQAYCVLLNVLYDYYGDIYWRLVSVRFDPSDDEYTITLHHSPILDSL